MKIAIILTSHDELGTTGRKTGFWLEELAAPYYRFKKADVDVVIVSPQGGQPPLDPKSNEPSFQTDLTRRFEADAEAMAALANTVRLDSISADDFDTVFYAGGHGPLWDLAEDEHRSASGWSAERLLLGRSGVDLPSSCDSPVGFASWHRGHQSWHRWQRHRHRCGLERLDHEGGEAAGGRDSCCRRVGMDAVVGHDHEDEIVHHDVGAQMAGVLGAADQLSGAGERGVADRGEVQRVWVGRHEGRGEPVIAGLQLAELLDGEAEAVPRIGVGEPFVHERPAGEHLIGERLGDQHLLGRKMAIQGGRADLGAPGDLPHRHIQAIDDEHRAGRVEDAFAVVAGIGTQSLRQTSGHRSHFS